MAAPLRSGNSGRRDSDSRNLDQKDRTQGYGPRYDSYSGFADDGGRETELDEALRREHIRELIVFGLATDYCVKFTVMDALNLGYAVEVRLDLCRGVAPDTTEAAIREMKENGAVMLGGV